MIHYKFTGFDVSAEWFDVCLMVESAPQEERFSQNDEGLSSLARWLKEFKIHRIWAILEHTGGYERKLAEFLLEQGHQVSLVDGLQVLRFKESLRGKSKTDKVSARVLERFGRERRPALWSPRPDIYQQLLELTRHRQSLVDDTTSWRNRLAAPKTNAVVQAQQATVIQVLKLHTDEIEVQLRELVASDSEVAADVKRLCTVKGTKFITAVGFLSEAGPISQYQTPNSLALAAGLVPLPNESGKSFGKRARPYGNERLRRYLDLPASLARRYDPALGLFAARIAKRKGKDSKALLNRAIKRKLCHIFWGLLTRQEEFDPTKAVKNFPNQASS